MRQKEGEYLPGRYLYDMSSEYGNVKLNVPYSEGENIENFSTSWFLKLIFQIMKVPFSNFKLLFTTISYIFDYEPYRVSHLFRIKGI